MSQAFLLQILLKIHYFYHMIKVVLIGSGNVAQHLIQVLLQSKEVDLVQAFARNPSHLSHLLAEEKLLLIIKNYRSRFVHNFGFR